MDGPIRKLRTWNRVFAGSLTLLAMSLSSIIAEGGYVIYSSTTQPSRLSWNECRPRKKDLATYCGLVGGFILSAGFVTYAGDRVKKYSDESGRLRNANVGF